MRAIVMASVVTGLAGAILLDVAAAAQAQTAYPTRPVSLIVPYGAGGVADVGMRILGERLSSNLKQQFIIENRPGAGGIIAIKAGLSAAPDGYTLSMTGNNNAIAAALFKTLPYNILTDFASVSTVSFFDVLIVTRAGSPLHSIARRDQGGQGQSGQAQHRHHQSRQHAEPRRRTVQEHGRHHGDHRAVPHLARHGDRGAARRRRHRVRVLSRRSTA